MGWLTGVSSSPGPGRPGRRSWESLSALPKAQTPTSRRGCHRSGKGAWTAAEQLRSLQRPPGRRRRALGRGAQVRSEIAPGCLAIRLPRKHSPRPPRSASRAPPLPPPPPPPGPRVLHGGERCVHARDGRRHVLRVRGGDGKVDGGGDAHGQRSP